MKRPVCNSVHGILESERRRAVKPQTRGRLKVMKIPQRCVVLVQQNWVDAKVRWAIHEDDQGIAMLPHQTSLDYFFVSHLSTVIPPP